MSDEPFERHFAALRDRFSTRLCAYREQLDRARTDFVNGAGPESIRELKRISHELAGASGVFGFAELGEAALALERAADAALQDGRERKAVIAPLRQLMRELALSV
ncbi:MAG TPA: Hpt domain-containing protein [Microvirga sp.]|jgi:HPt (histidine-containing phosphotransfer) domain-containing protein|nr:Hpt domain-containing protein [Microvirga sp.]